MKRDALRQTVSMLALIVMLVVNALANALPLNGLNTGEISDRFQVYFVPAGYVFSIWGLIYLALAAFVIYQALPAQRENPRLRRIGYLFALSCLANSLWIFCWHYELFPLSMLVMLALLVLLIAIYLRLGIGRTQASLAEKWLVRVPFSIYLGWITVATVANATTLLDFWRWHGWGIGAEAWGVIMLVAATAIASAVSLTRGDEVYMLVIMWAFIGIAVKQADTPTVATTAWVMTAIAAVMMALGVWLKRRQMLPVAANR